MRFLLVISLLAMPLLAATPAVSPEDEIRAAEQSWVTAVKARDTVALEKIFTPELIYGHASGAVETRQKYLDRLKAGKQRYDTMTFESTKIVMYGQSAVTHFIARFTGVNDAGPFNDHLMLMHFWVKQGGVWRLAGHQTAKLP